MPDLPGDGDVASNVAASMSSATDIAIASCCQVLLSRGLGRCSARVEGLGLVPCPIRASLDPHARRPRLRRLLTHRPLPAVCPPPLPQPNQGPLPHLHPGRGPSPQPPASAQRGPGGVQAEGRSRERGGAAEPPRQGRRGERRCPALLTGGGVSNSTAPEPPLLN